MSASRSYSNLPTIAFIGHEVFMASSPIFAKYRLMDFTAPFVGGWLRVRPMEYGDLSFPDKPDAGSASFPDCSTICLENAFNIRPRYGRANRIGKYDFKRFLRCLLFIMTWYYKQVPCQEGRFLLILFKRDIRLLMPLSNKGNEVFQDFLNLWVVMWVVYHRNE